MAIRFFCPLGHRLKVPDERAGKKGRCPLCQQRLVVPQISAGAAMRWVLSASEKKLEAADDFSGSNADLTHDEPVAIVPEATDGGAPAPTQPRAPGPPAAEQVAPYLEVESVGPAVAPPQAMPPATVPLEAPLIVVSSDDTAPALLLYCDEPLLVESGSTVDTAQQGTNGRQAPLAGPPASTASVDTEAVPDPLPAAGPRITVSPPPLPPVVSLIGVVPAGPVRQGDAPAPARHVRWAVWARGDAQESFAISGPTPRQLEVVYWLACLLPFAAVFCAAPAVPHVQFAGAPAWAQALLCIACLQFAYAAWLAMVPDWSTVRVGMYLFGAVATLDLLDVIAISFLPESPLASLGLAGTRATASAWCLLSAAVSGMVSAACRWIDHRWRAGKL